ncbi:hypothetical protein [Robertmurraya siralis]|uniref:hypothetical protein n=1 Tax=Robertmurraya siralis TaxID=77777 RepID=UPI0010F5D7F7|nr:hypothetical protein [Robertmurraya siralis]
MVKKISLLIGIISFILMGCGNKVDDQALESLSSALEKRWEFTDQLPDEITMEDLNKAIQIELDELEEYDIDDFKDTILYSHYSGYKSNLELMQITMKNESIDSNSFQEKWKEHMEKRAKFLHDINSKYTLKISDENNEIFKEVLTSANNLVKKDEIKDQLSEIKGITDLEVTIEDDSISVSFPTESVLSVDSFVSKKTGFPENAMNILKKLKENDFNHIVISTTNQDSIAISTYFTKDTLDNVNIDEWEELDSHDAYKLYGMSDAYNIRIGIWESLDIETTQLIRNMNKDSNNEFWKKYGFNQ